MELRWYQKEAVDAAYDYLCSESGNPVICLPTGSGKSLVIAEIARRAVQDFQGRVLVLQHRKELIEQNADKVRKLINIPIGEYSAGLRRFATAEEIVLCGIQSVYNKATLFDSRQLILIDEVHLCPNDGLGMYQTFLNDMRQINPSVRCIGLTATPFRTGEGSLCKTDGVFQKICYSAPIKQLIDEGFLCQVTNKVTTTHPDTSKLHVRYGEFVTKEVEALFGGQATIDACKEIVMYSQDRHSVMVFCSSVKHAETTKQILAELSGERVEMIEGGTLDLERSSIITDFINLRLKYLVNVDVLTTGFDAPCVDVIALLRSTASPGLFSQIVGRGLRTHASKLDCLVLDFGSNLERHGPIDAIDFGKPRSRRDSGPIDGPTKTCPNCELQVAANTLHCECGFNWPDREVKHSSVADSTSQVISDEETFEVSGCYFSVHAKEGKTPSMRVDYVLAKETTNSTDEIISEWVCIEHEGFARSKACKWWKDHSYAEVPSTVVEAVDLANRGALAIPRNITGRREGKFWRITSRDLEYIPDAYDLELAANNDECPF